MRWGLRKLTDLRYRRSGILLSILFFNIKLENELKDSILSFIKFMPTSLLLA